MLWCASVDSGCILDIWFFVQKNSCSNYPVGRHWSGELRPSLLRNCVLKGTACFAYDCLKLCLGYFWGLLKTVWISGHLTEAEAARVSQTRIKVGSCNQWNSKRIRWLLSQRIRLHHLKNYQLVCQNFCWNNGHFIWYSLLRIYAVDYIFLPSLG